MNYGIYSCYNVLSKMHEQLHSFPSDEMASARLTVHLSRIGNIDEWRIYHVGDIDVKTMEITPKPHSLIPILDVPLKDMPIS